MARKNAHVLGKNSQVYADALRHANGSPFGTRKPNGNELCTPFAGGYLETFFDYFSNSNLVIQTDNRQTFGATAPKLDTKQGKALNIY